MSCLFSSADCGGGRALAALLDVGPHGRAGLELVGLDHVVLGRRFRIVRRDLRRRLDIVQRGFDDVIGRASGCAHRNGRKQKTSEKKLRRA